MFSMPVIYNSSMKTDDGCMGTMHLNALNGSSGVLDLSNTGHRSNLNRNGSFGNLFPPSANSVSAYRQKDNNNVSSYRQKDNNKMIPDTLKHSQSSSTLSTMMTSSSIAISSNPFKPEIEFHAGSETKDFIGSRRSSLDLNATFTTHRRYDDRSFSLVEAMADSASRLSQHVNDPALNRKMVAGLNLSALRINQGIVKSTDYRDNDSKLPVVDSKLSALDSNLPVVDSKLSALDSSLPVRDSTCKSSEVSDKKSNRHSSESTMPGKTRKLLEKIKSNIDHNIHFKNGRGRRESRPDERSLSTPRSASLLPKKPRHDAELSMHRTRSRHREGENVL